MRPFLFALSWLALIILAGCAAPLTPTPFAPTPALALTPTPFPTIATTEVEFVWKLTDDTVQEPAAPYLDSQGNLYVLDLEKERVVKLNGDGEVLIAFGEHGAGEGQFNFRPVGTPLYHDSVWGGDLVVDQQGNIYVADGGNFRVQVFDAQGKYLRQWGKRGTAEGEFEVPWTIALDPNGFLYVGDFTGYIYKFDTNGIFLGKLGAGRGSGAGQFRVAVHDVEADLNGNIYASDFKLPRVFKFDPTGKLILQWNKCGADTLSPAGLGVDASGNVYVIDYSASRICKFDSQGNLLSAWGKPGNSEGEFRFGESADVAIDLDGNVYVTSDDPPFIQKFRRTLK